MNVLNLWRGEYLSVLFCAMLLCAPSAVAAQESPSVGELFYAAFDKKDNDAMRKLAQERTDEFPPEVIAMVRSAASPGVSAEEQDFAFNLAGTMAQMYGEVSKDDRLLAAVRKNYENVLAQRQAASLPPEAVAKAKEELIALGNKTWRISVFDLEDDGSLTVEIDVKDSASGSFTARIDMKTSAKAKAIVERHLPNITKGKISWSSMGVGLKAVFLGEGQ